MSGFDKKYLITNEYSSRVPIKYLKKLIQREVIRTITESTSLDDVPEQDKVSWICRQHQDHFVLPKIRKIFSGLPNKIFQ